MSEKISVTSKWTTVDLIKLSACVFTSLGRRHTCNPSVLSLRFETLVHIEYVTHRCGHASEVAAERDKSERRRRCRRWCSLLFMFNRTPRDDEWDSSLIVVKSRTTFYPLIYWHSHKWEKIVKQHLPRSLLLTSYACSSGDVVDFRFIESIWTLNDRFLCLSCNIHILICWIGRQMCWEERETNEKNTSISTLPRSFLLFPMHLPCISDLLRLSWFERTTQFAFPSYTNDLSCISLDKECVLVGCH